MPYPRFCPNPKCRFHAQSSARSRWWVKNGHYRTACHGLVQRFRCRSCHAGLSAQTFSIDYAAKRRVSYRKIFEMLTNSSGIRAISRALSVSHQLILNRISRLARQSLAVHAILLGELSLSESLVADGFESFVDSQHTPNNIHLLAGQRSQFLYAFDYAHLKRKGRMSEEQRAARDAIWDRFVSGRRSINHSFSYIVEEVERLTRTARFAPVNLITDEKREYQQVIGRSSFLSKLTKEQFRHLTVSSKKARTKQNRLFSVNYLDREIRKDNANHVRETVQFSRNTNNCMERLAIYRMYHNYLKRYRIEPRQEQRTHAEVAGIRRESVEREIASFFQVRRLISKVGLRFSDALVWFRALATPERPGSERCPDYAWA